VAFDLWQVKTGTVFDNIIITDDEHEADAFLQTTWTLEQRNEEMRVFRIWDDERLREEDRIRNEILEERNRQEAEMAAQAAADTHTHEEL